MSHRSITQISDYTSNKTLINKRMEGIIFLENMYAYIFSSITRRVKKNCTISFHNSKTHRLCRAIRYTVPAQYWLLSLFLFPSQVFLRPYQPLHFRFYFYFLVLLLLKILVLRLLTSSHLFESSPSFIEYSTSLIIFGTSFIEYSTSFIIFGTKFTIVLIY